MAGGGGVRGIMTTLVRRHPEQYLHKGRFTQYLQYFRNGGPSYMMMVSKHHASSVGFPDSGGMGGGWGGGWGWGGGDDDDIGTRTPRTISPQEPFYSVLTVLS